jgi:hypothetical protein
LCVGSKKRQQHQQLRRLCEFVCFVHCEAVNWATRGSQPLQAGSVFVLSGSGCRCPRLGVCARL